MNELKGKVAIVTGAASGIGRGIAECFAAEGAQVVLADVNYKGVQGAVEESSALQKGQAFPVGVDVASDDDVEYMVEAARWHFGAVDILVNNAGMSGAIGDPFPKNTLENWKRVYDVNTLSAVRTVGALWGSFTKQRSGRIINIASIVAHNRGGMQMKPAYNASKSALVSFTRWLAIQMAPHNVTVNSISPGLLFTGFWQKLGDQLRKERPDEYPPDVETRDVFLKRVKELVPLQREQTPYDIGHAAVFLASEKAQNITGIDLPVDGGVLAR